MPIDFTTWLRRWRPKERFGMTFEAFTDRRGEHRWRLVADNGRVIATSGESYVDPAHRDHMIAQLQAGIAGASVRPGPSTRAKSKK
jgi:hypothetical protein